MTFLTSVSIAESCCLGPCLGFLPGSTQSDQEGSVIQIQCEPCTDPLLGAKQCFPKAAHRVGMAAPCQLIGHCQLTSLDAKPWFLGACQTWATTWQGALS